jgi:hypothetical protein
MTGRGAVSAKGGTDPGQGPFETDMAKIHGNLPRARGLRLIARARLNLGGANSGGHGYKAGDKRSS